MAEILTPQQKQAIYDRGGRLLVSAAAGSGKTKVLVERLMSYIMDKESPANIDDFLIITYTKAAAKELRGKIASKLSSLISETADNRHLLQQLQRLHLTKISTVHAFCADILREYAYRLEIPADFRVADEEECLSLRMRAMDRILEDAYLGELDENFNALIDTQGFGRDDRRIPEVILQVYNAAKCHLDPEKWLDLCVDDQIVNSANDLSETVWGRYLIDDLHRYLDLQIKTLERCIEAGLESPEMQKPLDVLKSTVDQMRRLLELDKWDDISNERSIDYGRLVFSKKCTDLELVSQIKVIRDVCKAGLNKKLAIFRDSSNQMLQDYRSTLKSANGLISLVRKFDIEYCRLKHSHGILDFTDLEHMTLDLLLGKDRAGATKIATEVGERFHEVMVDEYQDSNAVQDAIFTVLTERKHNCFMVGDVKQSIYRFRLADPSIFIDKYNNYVPADEAQPGEGRKVVLSQNFRSSGAVIDSVNDVFKTCMCTEVGGLDYGDDEALYEGIPHVPLNEPDVELYGVDVAQDTYQEEASFVANKIAQLLDGKHMVRKGDVLQPIKADDIVILLRSPGSVGYTYQRALERKGIRCATGAGTDLLQTEEVEVLHSLLQVINNPLMDIPLVAVLLNRVFGFTVNDLAEIRKAHKYEPIYDALKSSASEKAKSFLEMLVDLRNAAQMCSVTQLLMHIFAITRIDSIFSALPDGTVRADNLQQFCQLAGTFESTSSGGLPKFLSFLDTLASHGISASTSENTTDAVTIMSIHKSKGLEFPVVFLCGLSRDFNMEGTHAQVLCDKELGIGLSCVDVKNRVQYPTIIKRAIASKMRSESISEEMRVLYVAMTRARDRLIMVYSAKDISDDLEELSLQIALSDPVLLSSSARYPGRWVLITALQQNNCRWKIQQVRGDEEDLSSEISYDQTTYLDEMQKAKIRDSLSFQYPHTDATLTPSKQTATQMKGREKDRQVAEYAANAYIRNQPRRKPSFANPVATASARGTAMHIVMQYINFQKCGSLADIECEINRLLSDKYINEQQAKSVNASEIANFFASDIGKEICTSSNVLREFKFSVLMDPSGDKQPEDHILLQGVVDCAIVDDDGITIIDFKSDRISGEDIERATERYAHQVKAYADALSRIYQLPVKRALLYFFHISSFASVI